MPQMYGGKANEAIVILDLSDVDNFAQGLEQREAELLNGQHVVGLTYPPTSLELAQLGFEVADE